MLAFKNIIDDDDRARMAPVMEPLAVNPDCCDRWVVGAIEEVVYAPTERVITLSGRERETGCNYYIYSLVPCPYTKRL